MLIPCPECNKEISDLAMLCPNCGFQNHQTDETATISDIDQLKEALQSEIDELRDELRNLKIKTDHIRVPRPSYENHVASSMLYLCPDCGKRFSVRDDDEVCPNCRSRIYPP
jgi:DNA-directed RNA polymerase subunit RPC12/RpoP